MCSKYNFQYKNTNNIKLNNGDLRPIVQSEIINFKRNYKHINKLEIDTKPQVRTRSTVKDVSIIDGTELDTNHWSEAQSLDHARLIISRRPHYLEKHSKLIGKLIVCRDAREKLDVWASLNRIQPVRCDRALHGLWRKKVVSFKRPLRFGLGLLPLSLVATFSDSRQSFHFLGKIFSVKYFTLNILFLLVYFFIGFCSE